MPDIPDHPLLDALDHVTDVAILVDELAEIIDGDFDIALVILARFHDVIRELGEAADIIGRCCIDLVPNRYETYAVPGGGSFHVRGGRERKNYDNDRLVSVAAARIRETMGIDGIVTADGEPGDADPVFDAVARTIARLGGMTAPSFSGWRTRIAKDLGIDLKEYCEIDETPLRASIEGRSR